MYDGFIFTRDLMGERKNQSERLVRVIAWLDEVQSATFSDKIESLQAVQELEESSHVAVLKRDLKEVTTRAVALEKGVKEEKVCTASAKEEVVKVTEMCTCIQARSD